MGLISSFLSEVGQFSLAGTFHSIKIRRNQSRHIRCLVRERTLGLILKSESPIERQILDYLEANPEAQDTMRGIVEWWILKQRIAESLSEVEAAVANLVTQRRVIAKSGPDGQVSYRLVKKAGTRNRNRE